MDEDLGDQLEPGWSVEDFEVGGVFDPAMLPGTGFGTWYEHAGTIEPAEKHSEEKTKQEIETKKPRNRVRNQKWWASVIRADA